MRGSSKPERANLFACWTTLVVLSVTALGCGNGNDPKVPGEPLGRFHVSAHIDGTTCGAGALGSSDVWEFDVQLSRRETDLYWLNGEEAIPGRLSSDGVSFAFDTRVAIQVAPPGKGSAGCTMLRSDQASGTLEPAGAEVVGFSGRLRFGYAEQPSSDCAPLVGVEGGFATLPCDMSYRLDAVRTTAPKP
jgi:hypothetical protein